MKTPRFLVAACVSLALAFTFSCSSDSSDDPAPAQSSSSGGGKSYRTVQIGEQTWMAENLNHAVAGSKCYGEDDQVEISWNEETKEGIYITLSAAEVQANCAKYGRLYDWATAMDLDPSCNSNGCSGQVQSKHRGICPEGWHIPSNDDWTTLIDYVESQGGCSNCAGTRLKATIGWNAGAGTDNYGFSALPGGRGYSDVSFKDVGYSGYWWSANEYYNTRLLRANQLSMSYNFEYANLFNNYKSNLFSVRCVQDQLSEP